MDTAGTLLVSYVYDAWGKVTATNEAGTTEGRTLIAKNPYLYRGYRYDSETGFYYLNSRYYDPGTGRFINADNAGYIGADGEVLSYNLYAYCLNNPVNRIDEGGTLSFWGNVFLGIAVIATIAAVSVATAGAGTAGVVAAVHCFATGALGGAITGAATGAVTGAAVGAVTHRLATGSWEGAGQAALEGSAAGFASGAVTGGLIGGITSNVCFIAGTLVLTVEGAKAIEEILQGDLVLSWDEETDEVGLKPVLETYVNETDELVHLYINDEEIITTPGHPFYSPIKGWTSAVDLRAGDILVLMNGEYVVVEQVQHEILEEPVKVYNFSVADCHTYYVTDSGVLVYNACERGVGGKGWEGDRTWRQNVSRVREGGTITDFEGKVPTLEQGRRLIIQAGGNIVRTEGAHPLPNPHTYDHINYMVNGLKGTLKILSVK